MTGMRFSSLYRGGVSPSLAVLYSSPRCWLWRITAATAATTRWKIALPTMGAAAQLWRMAMREEVKSSFSGAFYQSESSYCTVHRCRRAVWKKQMGVIYHRFCYRCQVVRDWVVQWLADSLVQWRYANWFLLSSKTSGCLPMVAPGSAIWSVRKANIFFDYYFE